MKWTEAVWSRMKWTVVRSMEPYEVDRSVKPCSVDRSSAEPYEMDRNDVEPYEVDHIPAYGGIIIGFRTLLQ